MKDKKIITIKVEVPQSNIDIEKLIESVGGVLKIESFQFDTFCWEEKLQMKLFGFVNYTRGK